MMIFKSGTIIAINAELKHANYKGYKYYSRDKIELLVPTDKFMPLENNTIPSFLIWENIFYSLFLYEKSNIKILTSDFQSLLNFTGKLRINSDNLREFVLFNTNISNKSFFKNITRHFGVASIIVNNNDFVLNYKKENLDSPKSIYDTFLNNIDSKIDSIKKSKHLIFLSGGGESRINAAIKYHYNLDGEFVTWGNPNDKEYKISKIISKKLNTNQHLIRPSANQIPYKEFLARTGYLSVMQYAYRYYCVQLANQIEPNCVLWTGWGDINGYPSVSTPTEMFSSYLISLFKGKPNYPKGWNPEWLKGYNNSECLIHKELEKQDQSKIVNIYHEFIAPRIFGSVLSAEAIVANIYAPWFSVDLYNAVKSEEKLDITITQNKRSRVIWKGDLYFKILQHYNPSLNHIWHAKGYYPFLLQKHYGLIGLMIASLSKKIFSYKKFPFDPIEDKTWMALELTKILDSHHDCFDKKEISGIISNQYYWKGYDIFEYFKLIQINWLFDIFK